MAECLNCGSENPDGTAFCMECGHPLPTPEVNLSNTAATASGPAEAVSHDETDDGDGKPEAQVSGDSKNAEHDRDDESGDPSGAQDDEPTHQDPEGHNDVDHEIQHDEASKASEPSDTQSDASRVADDPDTDDDVSDASDVAEVAEHPITTGDASGDASDASDAPDVAEVAEHPIASDDASDDASDASDVAEVAEHPVAAGDASGDASDASDDASDASGDASDTVDTASDSAESEDDIVRVPDVDDSSDHPSETVGPEELATSDGAPDRGNRERTHAVAIDSSEAPELGESFDQPTAQDRGFETTEEASETVQQPLEQADSVASVAPLDQSPLTGLPEPLPGPESPLIHDDGGQEIHGMRWWLTPESDESPDAEKVATVEEPSPEHADQTRTLPRPVVEVDLRDSQDFPNTEPGNLGHLGVVIVVIVALAVITYLVF